MIRARELARPITVCLHTAGARRPTSKAASLDMIAPGRRSVPPHPEAQTVTVAGAGHVGLLTNPRVVDGIVAALPTYEQVAA
jgi:hypothetical protein